MGEMDRRIRAAAAGRQVQPEASTPAVSDAEAQELARVLGLTLSEARERLVAARAGPPPVPPGHAGAGTGTQPPAAPDMDKLIRRAVGY